MAAANAHSYLDHGSSDESDHDAGYDSEAAEVSKTNKRATKRRKVDHDTSDDEVDSDSVPAAPVARSKLSPKQIDSNDDENKDHERLAPSKPSTSKGTTPEGTTPKDTAATENPQQHSSKSNSKSKSKKDKPPPPPGVVYLSSLPPYLKPSALRNLLLQRGFHPITRLFLAPLSKHKSASRKNSRQLYGEGWIEFASKKTARLCAETLNAQSVGGKKGGFYHDDIWNMKYLRGMRWEELMAGGREEKREVEGRRDEERRTIMKETKAFVEGVEEGRRMQGMKRKKEKQGKPTATADGRPDGDEVKRTWRQFDVQGSKDARQERQDKVRTNGPSADDVRQVLGKIF